MIFTFTTLLLLQEIDYTEAEVYSQGSVQSKKQSIFSSYRLNLSTV